MALTNALVVCVFLTALIITESSGKRNSHRGLRNLYNSKVIKAERMTRPLRGLGFQAGPLSHSGVRVTLEDGSRWLVHKGRDFGRSSQTVVVDAAHMSDKWKTRETKDFQGSKTVSDLVKAGGTRYRPLLNNCHHAAKRMMKN